MRSSPVCVVVVNWNGWRDTIECVRSLRAVRTHPLSIVICDNASDDGSSARLVEWLRRESGVQGQLVAPSGPAVEALSFPASDEAPANLCAVDLLRLSRNVGYAGGLNAGIAWGSQRFGASTFWLLNNDVKVDPHALAALIAARDAVANAGLCGSVLLDWDPPHHVQAVGGIYRKALGAGWHQRRLPCHPGPGGSCVDIDYPVGASLLVEQDYLERVGPMDDSYFLYYEEMDWAERGRRAGLRPVVALGSRVYHKEGASTGSHGGVRHKSLLSEHYGVVNRLRITRRFWPALLPLVWLSLWLVFFDRMLHGEGGRAWLVLRLMFAPGQWLRDPLPAQRSQAPTRPVD